MGSTVDYTSITSLLLGNIDLLEQFIAFFEERAHDLISRAEKERILAPSDCFKMDYQPLPLDAAAKRAFLKTINHSEIKANRLTERELQCIRFSLQGKTAKEVAKLLQISSKTVENHINNLKDKLGFKTGALSYALYFAYGKT